MDYEIVIGGIKISILNALYMLASLLISIGIGLLYGIAPFLIMLAVCIFIATVFMKIDKDF